MSFFDNRSDKAKNFSKVTKGKSKNEIRKAEEALLKPEPLEIYKGEKTKHRSELASRKAIIVFKDKKQQKLINELMSVRESVNGEVYITDISMLENLAKAVRNGEMRVIDNKLTFVDEPDDPDTVHSMEEFQAKYFPKDVGKKCFTCGRKKKKKHNKYTTAIIEKAIADNTEKCMNEMKGSVEPEVVGTQEKVGKVVRRRSRRKLK